MKKKFILLIFFSFGIALAQTMTLSPAVTDNGGGIRTGTGLKLLASIGQSVGGITNSSSNELQAGYITLETRLTGIHEPDVKPPQRFEISAFHPNPFNSATRMTVDLPKPGTIIFELFDICGNKTFCWSGEKSAGRFVMTFSPSEELPTGLYFYRLSVLDKIVSGKLTLIK